MHVDYWNYLGWKDEFSSTLFSQRQEFYVKALKINSAYTPQMVVDGLQQFTGTDLGSAAKSILEAAKQKKAKIEIIVKESKLAINVADAPLHENSTVYLAITEDNLSRKIGRGENSGKTLEHQSVVRELRSIGALASSQNNFVQDVVLEIKPDWKRENLKFVVFIQENESRKVLGAARIAASKN